MSSDYLVGPTDTDNLYALQYAEDKIAKHVCEAHPEQYTWIPSQTTSYPCPAGLICEPGVCKFTKEGCLDAGEFPYYDCERETVDCDLTPSGKCEVCKYSISKGHNITGPYISSDEYVREADRIGCYAGDRRYAVEPEPLPAPYLLDVVAGDGTVNKQAETCEVDADCSQGVCGGEEADVSRYHLCYTPNEEPEFKPVMCRGQNPDPEPYHVDVYDDDGNIVSQPVACIDDFDCVFPPGAGGMCQLEPNKRATGYCYDMNAAPKPYLEWRDEAVLWTGEAPSKNLCLRTLPEGRRWCEMPWTRPGANDENTAIPMEQRVKNAWKTKARPPFWYNRDDGSCHVTKKYCTNNLKNGGFSTGYGTSENFYFAEVCKHPDGDDLDIADRYDCCTEWPDGVAQFFIGRTLGTDFRELVEGDADGFKDRWGDYLDRSGMTAVVGNAGERLQAVNPGMKATIDFLSDPRLKTALVVIHRNILPGVNGYSWRWSDVATRLYGLHGQGSGMLTTELQKIVPDKIVADQHGFNRYVVELPADDPVDASVLEALRYLGATPSRQTDA